MFKTYKDVELERNNKRLNDEKEALNFYNTIRTELANCFNNKVSTYQDEETNSLYRNTKFICQVKSYQHINGDILTDIIDQDLKNSGHKNLKSLPSKYKCSIMFTEFSELGDP